MPDFAQLGGIKRATDKVSITGMTRQLGLRKGVRMDQIGYYHINWLFS